MAVPGFAFYDQVEKKLKKISMSGGPPQTLASVSAPVMGTWSREAGVSEEKARAAARALASYDQRFAQIENHFSRIEGKLQLHDWMLGTIIALLITVLFRLFTH